MSNFKKYLNNVQQMRYNEEDDNPKEKTTPGSFDNITSVKVEYSVSDMFSKIARVYKDAIISIFNGGRPQNLKERPGLINRTREESASVREYEISINDFIADIENSIRALKSITLQNITKSKDSELTNKLRIEADAIDNFESAFDKINRETKFI